MAEPLVVARGLVKHYRGRHGTVRALDGVDIEIGRGETLAIVGESGSGKSTLARVLLRLVEPDEGSITFNGEEFSAARGKTLRTMRREMQMVFQDPQASLNPKMRVETVIAEPLVIQGIGDAESRRARVDELMTLVGLEPAWRRRYPRDFSGGQRQRIAIARALASEPSLIVGDEPVSALDVSVQGQILSLFQRLQSQLGVAYLFISHDLSVVRELATTVAVMHLGRLVEVAPTDELFANPRHPYTKALLSAVPVPDPAVERGRRRIVLQGDPPDPANPPSGCRFRLQCWKAQERCAAELPGLELGVPGHGVACFFPDGEAHEVATTASAGAPGV